MADRQIVKIDGERYNGCGQCVSPCVEGAVTITTVRPGLNVTGPVFYIGICPRAHCRF